MVSVATHVKIPVVVVIPTVILKMDPIGVVLMLLGLILVVHKKVVIAHALQACVLATRPQGLALIMLRTTGRFRPM